ncbi:uncharacterized protein K452DRAFT_260871 [Aplosporella prunicola CBS 121167]|uniref:Exonuclease domain-containing protein n=1 Tax=Aplosporella prunicola CBS 121167 TaxID=1176127 RepID=A0A6A6ATJ2_9PEZI|nr:uncharacterized protein K452DRAFT_260871 [Aplosporella prunicola CBS 121167]KAF2135289.1 hypothetical protein K452DRAFT_260871 [Aplosporella prunicola CBS 121167]
MQPSIHEYMATSLTLSDDSSAPYPDPDPDPIHLAALQALVIPCDKLQEQGYVLDTLTEEDLERQKRCAGCGKTMGSLLKRRNKLPSKPKPQEHDGDAAENPAIELSPSPGQQSGAAEERPEEPATAAPVLRCRFHAGALVAVYTPVGSTRSRRKMWSCCSKPPAGSPCSGAENHVAAEYPPGQMHREWQYHATRPHAGLHATTARPAVAIDCEMGTAMSGDSELIRVTLIDYFTDEVLVDSLVFPDVPMLELRTRFSGVTWNALRKARPERTCLFGRDSARDAVWRFVGPETVVVGHSANNDLKALRWMHRVVVDTFLLEALRPAAKEEEEKEEGKKTESDSTTEQSVPPTADQTPPTGAQPQKKKLPRGSSPMSLKSLAKAKLGREIQKAGKSGHDSLEDALATRDLARWVVLEGLKEN